VNQCHETQPQTCITHGGVHIKSLHEKRTAREEKLVSKNEVPKKTANQLLPSHFLLDC
jgi:hypothetical protein